MQSVRTSSQKGILNSEDIYLPEHRLILSNLIQMNLIQCDINADWKKNDHWKNINNFQWNVFLIKIPKNIHFYGPLLPNIYISTRSQKCVKNYQLDKGT